MPRSGAGVDRAARRLDARCVPRIAPRSPARDRSRTRRARQRARNGDAPTPDDADASMRRCGATCARTPVSAPSASSVEYGDRAATVVRDGQPPRVVEQRQMARQIAFGIDALTRHEAVAVDRNDRHATVIGRCFVDRVRERQPRMQHHERRIRHFANVDDVDCDPTVPSRTDKGRATRAARYRCRPETVDSTSRSSSRKRDCISRRGAVSCRFVANGFAMFETLLRRAVAFPVIALDRVDDAVPLARCLADAGLTLIEDHAANAGRHCRRCTRFATRTSRIDVAIGTVRSVGDMRAARRRPAPLRMISPGTTPALIEAARDAALPWLPGVATASEVMALADAGLPDTEAVSRRGSTWSMHSRARFPTSMLRADRRRGSGQRARLSAATERDRRVRVVDRAAPTDRRARVGRNRAVARAPPPRSRPATDNSLCSHLER